LAGLSAARAGPVRQVSSIEPPAAQSPFEPLRYERFEEAVAIGPDDLLELYSTTSSLAALEPDERAALFANVRPLLGGEYVLPIKHELTWTRLAT